MFFSIIDTVEIVPHWKARGVDFFGIEDYYYIVRAENGVYLRAKDFHKGKDIKIFDISQACRGGDHYLATNDGYFYIIQGDMYRRVKNLNKDEDAKVFSLHRNCQGGDHYLSVYDYFYIIFKSRGVYRKTSNMNKDSDAEEFPLNPNCKGGLYYWGRDEYTYFLKPSSRWGIEYHRTTSLHKDTDGKDFSLHRDIINFLPGGLAITQGKAFGHWQLIKSITNPSSTKLSYTKEVSVKKGFQKEKFSSIEHHWDISLSYTYSTGGLSAAFAKSQFSMSASYGGSKVDTTTEIWDEASTVKETVTFELLPGKSGYLWQYVLGFKKASKINDVLFCRNLRFTDSNTPPTIVPLSSA